MPATAVDGPDASARLAEIGPPGPPRLSCVLEDLESGAIRVGLNGELDVATSPKADRALRAAERSSAHRPGRARGWRRIHGPDAISRALART